MFVFHQILQLQRKTKRTDYNTLGPFHNRYSLKDNKRKVIYCPIVQLFHIASMCCYKRKVQLQT